MEESISFRTKGGYDVVVDPVDNLGKTGKKYAFTMTHPSRPGHSFVYTPASSIDESEKNTQANESFTHIELEALLVFQSQYE